MKKIAVLIGTLAIFLFTAVFPLSAEEAQAERISTLLLLKNDLVMPQVGNKYYSQTVTAYWHYKWFGVGGDATYAPRKNFAEIKPYLTVNKGPYYALVGYAGNSLEQKYIQTGAWYVNKFGKTKVFLDLRNYWAANKTSVSYLEFWTSLYHPLGERFYVGFENHFAHFWDPKKSHNRFLLGPLAGVNITKTVSVYVRPSIIWDIVDRHTRRDFFLRVGLKFQF
jgi:hypothetical protein